MNLGSMEQASQEAFDSVHDQIFRHMVLLTYYDRSPQYANSLGGLGKPKYITGFLLSVREACFLVTAGHILDWLQDSLDRGANLVDFAIRHDFPYYQITDPKTCPTIEFDYKAAVKSYYPWDDEYGDYACILLEQKYVDALAKSGTVPFPAQHTIRLGRSDHFRVFGFPKQLIDEGAAVESETIFVSLTSISLTHVDYDDLPSDIKEEHADKKGDFMYFRLPPEEDLESEGDILKDSNGLSGGPIFGFRWEAGRGVMGGLVAVQSGWFPISRILFGCGMLPFTRAIHMVLVEMERNNQAATAALGDVGLNQSAED